MTLIRRRYLLLEIDSQGLIDWKAVYLKLIKTLMDLFGEFGLAQIELRGIASKGNLMVVRCKRGEEHKVRCAVLMLTSINGHPIKAVTLRVSGTLKSLKRILSDSSK